MPGATLAYGLALMHYLDRYAAKALTNYSAARNTSQAEVARLERELTSLPAAGAAWAAVAGAALMGVVYATVSPASAVASELLVLTSPAARVAELVVSVAMWAVLGTLVYHSVRQLRVVSDIYTRSTVVNLYRVSPLYALASLTARTAVGILVVPYSWFLLQPRSQEILTSWPYTLGFSVLAVVTFLLPLLGIHELLERDKKRLLLETSTRLEAAIAALHAHADASDYSTMSGHHDLLASLALEQAALEKISTWPWRPETPRILATAVLTPLLVFIAQRLLTSLLKL